MQILAPEFSELHISVYQFGPLTAVKILPPHLETEVKKNYLDDQTKENEMGRTHVNGSDMKCVQNFSTKT